MSDLDLITDRLELHGHRVTASRRAVLRAVLAQPAHFSVEDVLRRTRRVGRATVFRTMKILLDLNILCRIALEDGDVQYRLSTRGHHHHLVCVDCRRVEDFTMCDVAPLVRQLAAATEYEIEGHRLEVYGRCSDCRARTPSRAALTG